MAATPTTFWQWISTVTPAERFSLLIMGLSALVAIIAIVAGALYYAYKNRLEVSLKRELLDRGMSADEIATVISNSPKGGSRE